MGAERPLVTVLRLDPWIVKCKDLRHCCEMRINFEILDMRAFIAVSELRSFHGAAEALGLSQPALSRRIKGLEESIGTALLERSTRRVSPTAVGRQLEPMMRRLIEELETSVLSLSEVGQRQRGRVTVASIPTAAVYFLPRVIDDFNKQFPNIRFRIFDLSANEGLESIARGEVEFGINIIGATHPDLIVTSLLQDPFMLVCRRDYPLARRRKVSWAELSDHRLIGVSRESGNRIVLDNALAQANIQISWFYEVNHLSTAYGLMETGIGAAVLPRLATPPADHPIIVARPLVDPIVSRTIGVLERRSGKLSPAAQRFCDQLFTKWGGQSQAR
jgi:DNA-binding transcriptional LysR family regulator